MHLQERCAQRYQLIGSMCVFIDGSHTIYSYLICASAADDLAKSFVETIVQSTSKVPVGPHLTLIQELFYAHELLIYLDPYR